jgi:hypothetical protein
LKVYLLSNQWVNKARSKATRSTHAQELKFPQFKLLKNQLSTARALIDTASRAKSLKGNALRPIIA